MFSFIKPEIKQIWKMIAILFLFSQVSAQAISTSISGCGGTGADPVTCGKATVLKGQSHIGIPAACFNRVDPGPCSQDLIRIYYDHTTYTCKAFSYSGCGGNANRFVSIKNCYKLCHPYYRQRFISLANGQEPPDQLSAPGEPKVKNAENTTDSDEVLAGLKQRTKQTEETTVATTEEPTTTTTTEPTTTEEDRGVLYFSGGGKKVEVKPEIQVVHEYDTFQPQYPQMGGQPQYPQMGQSQMGGQPQYGAPIGSNRGQSQVMPTPHEAPGQMAESGHLQHGYLENVQHESYEPMGGFVKSGHHLDQTPIKRQEILFTK